MPTYDYRRADGSVFEIVQPITSDPLTECPTTGQPVERIISGGSGFILKGSGFYQTDYVSKPPAKKSESSPEKTESTKKDTSKPEDGKNVKKSKDETS